MCIVAAGYPSYIAHPVTLLAPAPLLVALVLFDDGRLVAPVWIALVAAMVTWTTLLYLAMDGTVGGLGHSMSMYAPFAALAFRIKRPERIAIVFAIGTTTLVCIRMIASYVRSGGRWVPWQVYEGNEMSARLNMLLPLVLVALLTTPRDRRWARALLVALLAAGVASVVLAQERAGLGVLAVLILVGLVRTNWRWLIVVGAAGLAAWVVASQSIVSVLERVRLVNFVPSNASRPEIWHIAVDGLRGSSWLGVGPGNSADALREVGGGHAHNNVVQTALEAGWPGAIAAAGLTAYVIVLAVRLLWRGGQETLWALSLSAYLGFSIISSPIVRPDFSLALILVIMVAREHLGARGDPCGL
jgi:O-antigen ligase